MLALAIIAFVVVSNIRGFSASRAAAHRRRWSPATLVLSCVVIVIGLVLFFNPHTLHDQIHLGSAPTWSGLIFALTITTVAFTSLESAPGLAGEVRDQPRAALRRLRQRHDRTIAGRLRRDRARRRHRGAGARRPHGARGTATSTPR